MAAPSLKDDPKTTIEFSFEVKSPVSYFVNHLGLPQSPESEKNRGRPIFEGSASSHCSKLWESVIRSRKMLIERFRTREAVREAAVQQCDQLIAEIVGPLFEEFGSVIWCASEPYVTRIGKKYPRYMMSTNAKDRKIIMLYIYCWIIAPAVTQTPIEANQSSKQPASLSSKVYSLCTDSEYEDEVEVSYDDGATSLTETTAATAGNETRNYDIDPVPSLMSGQERRIPAAQGLPTRGSITPRTTVAGMLRTPNHNMAATTVASDEVPHGQDDLSDSEPLRDKLRRIKRKGPRSLSRGPPKRSRDTNNYALVTSSHLRKPHEKSMDNCYPSPPSGSTSSPRGRKLGIFGPRGELNSGYQLCSLRLSNSNASSSQEHSEHRRPAMTSPKATPASAESPSSALSPRAMPQRDPLKVERGDLASKLHHVLFDKLNKPDIKALANTVELLGVLAEKDHDRLENLYGDDFNAHQGSFTVWVQCLQYLLTFYQDTGFEGNLSTRDAFMDVMPDDSRAVAMSAFLDGGSSLVKWQTQREMNDAEFSNKVASVLFNLASWVVCMKLHWLESLMQRFNEELLAWFR